LGGPTSKEMGREGREGGKGRREERKGGEGRGRDEREGP